MGGLSGNDVARSSDHRPVDPFLLRIFQNEIACQCRYLLGSARDLIEAVAADENDSIWRGIQGVLSAAAMVSKALWNDQAKFDRSVVRRSLGIDDTSPFKSRDVRNYSEHIDEKIEKTYQRVGRQYVGRIIGPPTMIFIEEELPGTRFHEFDPATMTVSILGRSVSLHEVIVAARELLPIAERKSR